MAGNAQSSEMFYMKSYKPTPAQVKERGGTLSPHCDILHVLMMA